MIFGKTAPTPGSYLMARDIYAARVAVNQSQPIDLREIDHFYSVGSGVPSSFDDQGWTNPFGDLRPQATSTPNLKGLPVDFDQDPSWTKDFTVSQPTFRQPRPPVQTSRFPVRGILRKNPHNLPPLQPLTSPTLAANRVRFSSPREYLYSPVSHSTGSGQSRLSFQATEAPGTWAHPETNGHADRPSAGYDTALHPTEDQGVQRHDHSRPQKSTSHHQSAPLQHQASDENSDRSLRLRGQKRSSSETESMSGSESPQDVSRPRKQPRQSIPTPLAQAYEGIVSKAFGKPTRKNVPAVRRTRGQAVVQALEEAAEDDGYESDELNLRPVPRANNHAVLKPQVSPRLSVGPLLFGHLRKIDASS